MFGVASADELSDLREKVNRLELKVNQMEVAPAPTPSGFWKTGVKEGGGGFFLESPEKDFSISFLGYVQSQWNYWGDNSSRVRAGTGRPVSNDFSIRRARLDWIATLYKNTEFFVEIDGAPATSSTATSDFALVQARLTQEFCDAFSLQLGKFTTPFSTENARSSRAIDTVDRYVALNSFFGLPATDVQFGAMAMGNVFYNRVSYNTAVVNGNGRANDNFRDNNSSKEVQVKLTVRPWEGGQSALSKASAGVGFSWNRELTGQTLALNTLGGARVAAVGLSTHTRVGYSFDFVLPVNKVELRGEGLAATFRKGAAVDATLYGGFLQASYALWKGNGGASFAPLVRAESAVISNDLTGGSGRLNSLTIGWNAWLNPNVRWQLNYVPSSASSTGGVSGQPNQHYDEVFSQVQFKI